MSLRQPTSGRGAKSLRLRRTAPRLMVALKIVELWEWQYGEYAAGMLKKHELPIGAWGLWFHGKGPFPVPIRVIYDLRKSVLNEGFVSFFEENVVARVPD